MAILNLYVYVIRQYHIGLSDKSTVTLQSRIKAQCALIVFGSKIQPGHAYQRPCVYYFWKKIHPVRLLNTVCLLNLGFFLKFFWTFPPILPKFFSFLCQFYPFSPFSPIQSHWLILGILAKITLCVYSILCVY